MNRNVERFIFIEEPAISLDVIILGGSRGKIITAIESACSKIPLAQRQMLLKWWQRYQNAPIVVFLDATHIEVSINGQQYIALGACEDIHGVNIQFAGRASYKLVPQILETLIAHEFAHVALSAEISQGKLSADLERELNAAKGDPIKESAWHEKHADKRAREWNAYFDCAALRRRHREYTQCLFPNISMDQLTGPPHEEVLERAPDPPSAEHADGATAENQPIIPRNTLARRIALALLVCIVLVIVVSIALLVVLR